MILALDLGTATGWALGDRGLLVAAGTTSFKATRFEGGGMRYLHFRRWLSQMHTLEHFSEVVFEEVRRHLGVDAAHAYGGFLATLQAWCEEKHMPYSARGVQAIKSHATGHANAGKDLMLKACLEWVGRELGSDNEADAIALLSLATGEPAWPPQPKPPKKAKT